MRVLGNSLCLDRQPPRRGKVQVVCVDKDCRLDAAAAAKLVPPLEEDRVWTSPQHSAVKAEVRKTPSRRLVLLLLIGGGLSLFFGCISLIWTPFDVLMNERLRMMPGFPPYEWWKSPPDEVLLRVYVFNITNGEQFLNGEDEKLKFEEIGPFIYLEKLVHNNIIFHDNSTMTYTAHRTAHWLPEMNTISLNETLVLPNLAVLGIASYLHDASFITKIGYNILLRQLDSQPLVTTTVYDYFWNFSDPVIQVAQKLSPSLVPVTNMGILHRIYSDFKDNVTVFIGTHNGHRFFTMDQYHDSPRFGYWQDETCDAVKGATEGVVYQQYINRNDSLKYFRKTICRITPVYYSADIEKDGMSAYRFELPDNIYGRPEDPENECYRAPGTPLLPSGLSDVSPCYYDFPIAASHPHFFSGDPQLLNSIDGLTPDRDKHTSYVIVEPITGIPMESRARSQSNLVMRKVTAFPRVRKFDGLVLPMFWAEYNQVGLPGYIYNLMYFTVNILPELQKWLSFLMILLGGVACLLGTSSFIRTRKEKPHMLHSYSSLDGMASTSLSEC